MYAVVVDVTISDFEAAHAELEEQVIPRVKQAPGFVHGVWVRPSPGSGHSIVVFENEQGANAMAEMVRGMPRSAVTVDSVAVMEVVATA